MKEDVMKVWVRVYDHLRDKDAVQDVECMCDVGSGKLSLFTDLLGDPIGRVRYSPAYLMLVAEICGGGEEKRQIVGLVRGCVKTVTCGRKTCSNGKPPAPIYAKVGYVLGLRVSPYHRRKGVGVKLVSRLEMWFRKMGVEYSYMATEKDNEASMRLFTHRCGYSKFRTPSILVHPVFAHSLRSPSHVTVFKLPTASDAEALYRRRFSTTEFFPRDIDAVLGNPLCLGTFIAVESGTSWSGAEAFLREPPPSWAVMSVWNCKDVYRLEVRGVSRWKMALAKATRVIDRALPWLHIPSVPNLFRPFGLYFLFGLGGEGPRAGALVTALCSHAHNMARKGGCDVIATEVASCDPLQVGIPRWKSLSCEEDLWCIKRLGEDLSDSAAEDWIRSAPGPSIFVDPREI